MELQLTAGHAALDFANHTFESVEDFLGFAEAAGVVKARRRLPVSSMDRVVKLREALHELFHASAGKRASKGSALVVLNEFVHEALTNRIVVKSGEQFEWRWQWDAHDPLWTLALEAAELLTSNAAGQVKACESETCRWLFLDRSKNHKRRWCDMKICGNRTKARRYYARRAAKTTSAAPKNDIAI